MKASEENEILKRLLKNEFISKKVKELDLNNEQMIQAIPIMLDMMNEFEESSKDPNSKKEFVVSMKLVNNEVKRTHILSNFGKQNYFKKNISCFDIANFDVSEDKEFIKEPGRKSIVNKFSEILNNNITNKGIYIWGKMGIGKTFILKKFAIMLAQKNKKVAFINIPVFLEKYRDSFKTNNSIEEFKNDFKNVDYLFLDDIGAEPIYPWFRDQILLDILSFRAENNLSIFYSSNYSIKQLEKIQSLNSNNKDKSNYSNERDKAARLIERIKATSIEMELIGSNKRY